jgi:hypothetical protein
MEPSVTSSVIDLRHYRQGNLPDGFTCVVAFDGEEPTGFACGAPLQPGREWRRSTDHQPNNA